MNKYRKSLIFCMVFCAALISAAVYDLYTSYRRDEALARFQIANVTTLLSEWIKGSMQNTDYVLRDIVGRVPVGQLRYPAPDPRMQQEITALVVQKKSSLPNAAGVGLAGPDCILSHTSAVAGVDVSQREWCIELMRPGVESFVSHMYMNKQGRASVAQVRRFPSANGSFTGMAGISVDLGFFSSWLKNLSVGQHDVALIADTWLSLLASNAAYIGEPGRKLPHAMLKQFVDAHAGYATLHTDGLGDGVQRLYGMRKIEALPFFVVYGIADEEWLAGWRRQLVNEVLTVMLICFMAVAMLRVYHTQLRQEERLQQLANTDPLTGVANRRYFLEHSALELKKARRALQDLALLIIDIDHFKPINDTYGHAVGDRAVMRFAGICKRMVRDVDLLGRFGGDEFIVLLPATGIKEALQVAERLRSAVESDTVLRDSGVAIQMTSSIGAAIIPADAPDISAALAKADAALYRAKQNGRNRVENGE